MPDLLFLSALFSPTVWRVAWKLMQPKSCKTSEQTSSSPNFLIALNLFFLFAADGEISLLSSPFHWIFYVLLSVNSFYHGFQPPSQFSAGLSNTVLVFKSFRFSPCHCHVKSPKHYSSKFHQANTLFPPSKPQTLSYMDPHSSTGKLVLFPFSKGWRNISSHHLAYPLGVL